MKRTLVIFAILSLLISCMCFAARIEHVTEKVDMEKAKELIITFELGAGEFVIIPEDITEAAIINITYNPRRVDYTIDSDFKKGKCFLDIETEHHRKSNIDTDDNNWEISLSTKYTTSMNMDIGACEADLDFGGIPFKEFNLDIGAASGNIYFSEPNPIKMERLDIDAGATSLDMHSVGNANFEYMNFSGGVGSFDLDFRGEYNGESIIDIDIGLGSADIILPRRVPVRIITEGSNWLSSVD
ncbi:MAG: hypothetical protein ACE5D6_04585, partial [Candidatus Zixiibacteriota bacterium]